MSNVKRASRQAAIVAAFLNGDAISNIELEFDLPRADIEPVLRKAWLAERKGRR